MSERLNITDTERQAIANDFLDKEKQRAPKEIEFHAGQIFVLENQFSSRLAKLRDGGQKLSAKEYEAWEDDYAYEWQKIEKQINLANLNSYEQADALRSMYPTHNHDLLTYTVEAQAGNFYSERQHALIAAIDASDSPDKAADRQLASTFWSKSVHQHLGFRIVANATTLSMDDAKFLEGRRLNAHNQVIEHLNDINDLCRKYHTRPLTVRNFWPSTVPERDQTPALSDKISYDHYVVQAYYDLAFSADVASAKRSAGLTN